MVEVCVAGHKIPVMFCLIDSFDGCSGWDGPRGSASGSVALQAVLPFGLIM
jgi:hypothetical protein